MEQSKKNNFNEIINNADKFVNDSKNLNTFKKMSKDLKMNNNVVINNYDDLMNLINDKISKTQKTQEIKEVKTQKINFFKRKLNIIKEYTNLIKLWFIAEFNIYNRLASAIKFKNKELKIRNKLSTNKLIFVSKHGYEEGITKYNKICKNVANGVDLHKRVLKTENN